jgi:hypothetical protein
MNAKQELSRMSPVLRYAYCPSIFLEAVRKNTGVSVRIFEPAASGI